MGGCVASSVPLAVAVAQPHSDAPPPNSASLSRSLDAEWLPVIQDTSASMGVLDTHPPVSQAGSRRPPSVPRATAVPMTIASNRSDIPLVDVAAATDTRGSSLNLLVVSSEEPPPFASSTAHVSVVAGDSSSQNIGGDTTSLLVHIHHHTPSQSVSSSVCSSTSGQSFHPLTFPAVVPACGIGGIRGGGAHGVGRPVMSRSSSLRTLLTVAGSEGAVAHYPVAALRRQFSSETWDLSANEDTQPQ